LSDVSRIKDKTSDVIRQENQKNNNLKRASTDDLDEFYDDDIEPGIIKSRLSSLNPNKKRRGPRMVGLNDSRSESEYSDYVPSRVSGGTNQNSVLSKPAMRVSSDVEKVVVKIVCGS
jgi:hypothetical protein